MLSSIFIITMLVMAIIVHVQGYIQFEFGKKFPTRPAAFGKPIDPHWKEFPANLFEAPSDNKFLCESDYELKFDAVPSSAPSNVSTTQSPSSSPTSVKKTTEKRSTPIALLVSKGVCEYETKAINAIRLNKKYVPQGMQPIRYLIVYAQRIGEFSKMSGHLSQEDSDSLSLFFITRKDQNYIKRYFLSLPSSDIENFPGRSPHLNRNLVLPQTDTNFNDMEVPILIDGIDGTMDQSRSFLTNVMLAGIIISTTLLLRVVFAFFSVKKLVWVRNDEGRIRGITTAPIERMTRRTRRRRGRNRILTELTNENLMMNALELEEAKNRLTFKEVMHLPRIEYGVSNIAKAMDEYNARTEKCDVTNEQTKEDDGSTSTTVVKTQEGSHDEEEETSSGELENDMKSFITLCSSCTICISDFEFGEKLILLPQCGHSFHPECISPWLIDRKAICPLCQTSVLNRNTIVDNNNNNGDGRTSNDIDREHTNERNDNESDNDEDASNLIIDVHSNRSLPSIREDNEEYFDDDHGVEETPSTNIFGRRNRIDYP